MIVFVLVLKDYLLFLKMVSFKYLLSVILIELKLGFRLVVFLGIVIVNSMLVLFIYGLFFLYI